VVESVYATVLIGVAMRMPTKHLVNIEVTPPPPPHTPLYTSCLLQQPIGCGAEGHLLSTSVATAVTAETRRGPGPPGGGPGALHTCLHASAPLIQSGSAPLLTCYLKYPPPALYASCLWV
jgi:hypothetical protein